MKPYIWTKVNLKNQFYNSKSVSFLSYNNFHNGRSGRLDLTRCLEYSEAEKSEACAGTTSFPCQDFSTAPNLVCYRLRATADSERNNFARYGAGKTSLVGLSSPLYRISQNKRQQITENEDVSKFGGLTLQGTVLTRRLQQA